MSGKRRAGDEESEEWELFQGQQGGAGRWVTVERDSPMPAGTTRPLHREKLINKCRNAVLMADACIALPARLRTWASVSSSNAGTQGSPITRQCSLGVNGRCLRHDHTNDLCSNTGTFVDG